MLLVGSPTVVHQQMVANISFPVSFIWGCLNAKELECFIGIICFQQKETSCKQSTCATRNKGKNHGNHGNIAAIGTEELSRGRNKITAVTCTEWHEKNFGVMVIVLVVTKRDHYLQCSK